MNRTPKVWGWWIVVDGQQLSLAELETDPVRSVSQIELTGAAFASLAQGLRDAAEGFMANATRSVEAPVDAGVLARLRGVMSGAEQAQHAAQAFLAAFHDHYDEDIAEARRREQMNNQALTG